MTYAVHLPMHIVKQLEKEGRGTIHKSPHDYFVELDPEDVHYVMEMFGDGSTVTKGYRSDARYASYTCTDILRLKPENRNFKGKVTVTSWNGDSKSDFVDVLKSISRLIGREIVLCVPHGDTNSPRRNVENKLYIHIWSAPSGMNSVRPPRALFGLEVSCRDEAFRAVHQGIIVQHRESSGGYYEVAELVDWNNLYIFHDIVNSGYSVEQTLLRRICHHLLAFLTLSKKEFEKYLEERYSTENLEAHYVELLKNQEDYMKQHLKETLESALNNIATLKERLMKVNEEAIATNRKLLSLGNDSGKMIRKLTIEYQRLIRFPGIKRITVEGSTLNIFTNELTFYHEEVGRRLLGEMHIIFDPKVGVESLRIFNLSRQVRGYQSHLCQHPHVYAQNGKPCLQGYTSQIKSCMERFDLLQAVTIIFQFLQNVTVSDSAGKYAENWPVYEEQTVTVGEGE